MRLLNCGHDFCETCITTSSNESEEVVLRLAPLSDARMFGGNSSERRPARSRRKARDRYHRLTVQKFVDNDEAACCPTAGCEYKFWFGHVRKLDCPSCSKVYCVSCRSIGTRVRRARVSS